MNSSALPASLINDPLVVGAFITLIGVLIGHFLLSLSKSREYKLALKTAEQEAVNQKADRDFETLKTTVNVLSQDYMRLQREVEALRIDMAAERKYKRIIQEKYSASLSYIGTLLIAGRGLFLRLDDMEIPHSDLPKIPHIITDDMLHKWPDLAEFADNLPLEDQVWNQTI